MSREIRMMLLSTKPRASQGRYVDVNVSVMWGMRWAGSKGNVGRGRSGSAWGVELGGDRVAGYGSHD